MRRVSNWRSGVICGGPVRAGHTGEMSMLARRLITSGEGCRGIRDVQRGLRDQLRSRIASNKGRGAIVGEGVRDTSSWPRGGPAQGEPSRDWRRRRMRRGLCRRAGVWRVAVLSVWVGSRAVRTVWRTTWPCSVGPGVVASVIGTREPPPPPRRRSSKTYTRHRPRMVGAEAANRRRSHPRSDSNTSRRTGAPGQGLCSGPRVLGPTLPYWRRAASLCLSPRVTT